MVKISIDGNEIEVKDGMTVLQAADEAEIYIPRICSHPDLPPVDPEQLEGSEADARSDIFAFGAVLYQMITGQRPFGGEHEAAVIYSIVNEQPEPLARFKADVPSALQEIVSNRPPLAPFFSPQSRISTRRIQKRDYRKVQFLS